MWPQTVLTLILILAFTSASCPNLGCGGSTNYLDTYSAGTNPRITWHQKAEDPSIRELLCTSSASVVVCGVDRGLPNTTGLEGLVAYNATGSESWGSYDISNTVAYPLRSLDGGVIATDGANLVGYGRSGVPFGPPVPIYGTGSLALALTDNHVVMICQPSTGLVGAYLTNGVPHASLRLTATIGGRDGLFIPLSSPIVGSSTDGSMTRVYVVTRFCVGNQANADHNGTFGLCGVFAIDVHRTMGSRLTVAWNYTYPCSASLTKDENDDVPLLLHSKTLVWGQHMGGTNHVIAATDEGSRLVMKHNTTVASEAVRINSISLFPGEIRTPSRGHESGQDITTGGNSVLLTFRCEGACEGSDSADSTAATNGSIVEFSLASGVATTVFRLGSQIQSDGVSKRAVEPGTRGMTFQGSNTSRGVLLTVRESIPGVKTSTVQLVALGRSGLPRVSGPLSALWSIDLVSGEEMRGVGTQVIDVGDSEGSVLVTIAGDLYAVGSH